MGMQEKGSHTEEAVWIAGNVTSLYYYSRCEVIQFGTTTVVSGFLAVTFTHCTLQSHLITVSNWNGVESRTIIHQNSCETISKL